MKEFYISSTKYSLQERQTAKRGKVYDVMFRVITHDGKEIQKKLSGYKTKKMADAAYTDFVTENCEFLKGAKKITAAQAAKQECTLSELFRIYLSEISMSVKESTLYDKKKTIDKFVMPQYGNKRMSDLTEDEIRKWQNDLFLATGRDGKRISYKYARKVRSHFSAFFDWAHETRKYNNPFEDVKAPKKSKDEPKHKREKTGKFWKEAEIEKFLDAVDDPMYKCLFTIMLYTGHRKGEIFALKPEYFLPSPEDTQSIHFFRSITRKTMDGSTWKEVGTKTGKDQVIPVCQKVRDAISTYKGESPYYFGGERPLVEKTVTYNFQQYCKKAGVPIITEHGMRHSFASLLAHNKASIFVIAELIGDEPDQVLKTYGHLYDDDMLQAVKSLN